MRVREGTVFRLKGRSGTGARIISGAGCSLLAATLVLGACWGGGESSDPEEAQAGTPSEPSSPSAEMAPSGAAQKAARAAAAMALEIDEISDLPLEIEDPDEAVRQLKGWLENDDRDIREAAILALWDVDSSNANKALAWVARNEADPELKGYAVEELVDREAPEALDALLAVLEDPDTDLREQAAEGLEDLADNRAIPGLYARLEKEEDEWVRDAILSALETVDPEFDESKFGE